MVPAFGANVTVASGPAFADAARSFFGNVRFGVFGQEECKTRLESAALGSCRLSRVETGANIVIGSRIVQRSYDVDAIKLILQVSGRSSFEQNDVGVILGPQSWIVYDPTRAYQLNNTTPITQLLLQVPRHNFSAAVLDYLARPHIFGGEMVGLPNIVATLMRSTIEEADKLDEASRSRVGDTLVRLASSLIVPEEDGEAGADSISLRTLRSRVKAYVESNLARGDLDIDEIAKRMGCSRRYVFRAFEAENTTPSQFIWELRLAKARERLKSEAFRAGTISEVAFSCGFSSSAHFSRAFRKRFGASPREDREAPAS